jgi:hypothetical protein
MQLPDRHVTVCDLTPVNRMVELRFTDPDDGVSEWIYHFSTTNKESGGGGREGD